MKEAVFADGSLDFGGGVIGPSVEDVVFFNSLPASVTTLEILEEKPHKNNRFAAQVLVLVNLVPKPLQKPAQVALLTTAAGLSAGAVCGGDTQPLKSSDLQSRLTYSLTLPFAAGETWWYTAGPHYDEGSKSRVKYAVDMTPTDKPIACPGGEPYLEKPVRAIADGVVTVVGNEKDPKDKNHSVVEIDLGSGFTVGSMHLDDMQVKVGQKVKQGDPLGYVSCEFPPGGGTSGEHLHEYGKLNGDPIEVDRIVMSGWTIEGTGENKQGTMKKSGQDIRTADTRRCGPQTYTIRACDPSGKIRNDISWKDPQDEYIATPKAETVPTRVLVPTLPPVPTVEKPVIPTVKLATPTTEVVSKKAPFVIHNPLDNVDWEFKFTTYLETPSYVYGQSTPREGWKRVIIKGNLVNESGGVADPQRITDLVISGGLYKFVFEAGGNPYDLTIGTDQGGPTPGRPDSITGAFEHESIASGASRNFLMTTDVPKNTNDVNLSLFSKQGVKIAGPITKSEILAKGSGSQNEILPGVEKHDTSEVWNLPGYASIAFGSIKTLSASTAFNGTYSEQFAVFDLTNNYGQDIATQYGLGYEIRSLKVYLPDGRQVDGDFYYNSKEAPPYGNIPPGFTKPVYVNFASNALVKEGVGGLVDTSGAVVVLTINDKKTSSLESFAWQLP